MNKNLPIFDIQIDEHDDETGMFVISFVDSPAMEVQGLALSQDAAPTGLKLERNEDEMTYTAPIIIPDKLIYRNQPTERYIRFSAEQIKKIRNKYFAKTGVLRSSNYNHNPNHEVPAHLIESWIIRDSKADTATSLGFDLPAGTLMGTYQVTCQKFWDEKVKSGDVGGFSLEGMFNEVQLQLAEDEDIDTQLNQLMEEVADILSRKLC